MGFWIFMLCMNLLLPFLMAGCGWAFERWPPEQINDVLGYRTARSKASQEAWDFAQRYMGRLWLRLGLWMVPVTALTMLPCLGKDIGFVGIWGGAVCAVECIVVLVSILPVEKALKKRFGDEEGLKR